MAKSFRPTGQERFNFITGLVAYLIHNDKVTLSEAANHFDVDESFVRDAISTLIVTETRFGNGWENYYNFDEDLLNEGIIHLIQNEGLEQAPKLSGRQASAIAAGLTYLSTFPHFTNQKEITELLEILGKGSSADSPRIIDYKPGTIDANAAIIRKAMLNGHRISCTYRSVQTEAGVREIDPLRLDPRGQNWYLRGYCHKNKEERNFRLDRMQGAIELDVPICDEAKAIGKIVDEEYTARETDVVVTVEVDPEAYSLINDFAAEDIQPFADNRTRAKIKVGYLPNLGRVIAHYGGAARVIEPEVARATVRNYALNALGKATDNQLGAE